MKKDKEPAEVVEIGPYGIKDPTMRVQAKYGIDLEWWRNQISIQHGLCPICSGTRERMVVDHEHVKGWKKMPPEKRRRYVRGIVCWFCNLYYLCRGMTVQKAINIVQYMRDYQERFDLGNNPEIAANRANYLTNYEAEKAAASARAATVSAAAKIRDEAHRDTVHARRDGEE